MFTSGSRRQYGLSLIELIMFMVIMGVAAAGVISLLNLSNKSSADPVRRKQALLIAEGYLEEVEQARFTFCDPSDPNATSATDATTNASGCPTQREFIGSEGSNSRPYDNVNDYAAAPGVAAHSFDVGGRIADAYGTVLGGSRPLQGFSATVMLNVVPLATAMGPAGIQVSSTAAPTRMEMLQITITVTYGTGANDFVTLDGYRSRYAPRSIP